MLSPSPMRGGALAIWKPKWYELSHNMDEALELALIYLSGC